jgi:uncharacterized protein
MFSNVSYAEFGSSVTVTWLYKQSSTFANFSNLFAVYLPNTYYRHVTRRYISKFRGSTNLQLDIIKDQAEVIDRVKSDPVVSSIHLVLSAQLDESLTYHSKEHSDQVTAMAIALGSVDRLDDRSLLLLGIGAAYHDAGFIEHRADHELVSAKLAEEAMSTDGRFSKEEIRLTRQMILDTKLEPTGPTHKVNTRLSPWLIDADLANLGRADFLEQTKLLADELDVPMDLMLNESLALMNRHVWQSPAGQSTLGNQKDQNKSDLINMLNGAL